MATCECLTEADCPEGAHCYAELCQIGTCRTAPPEGCFGDIDCPDDQRCIGGRPAPCGTTIADAVGTCGEVQCPEGDCGGSSGETCTCLQDGECIPAGGPLVDATCRADDGTCSTCKCASPDTPIATPDGERRLADLRVGDLVYSVDRDQVRAVPIARVNRVPVSGHRVLRVTFSGGGIIEMTAGHPLADGRALSSLREGSELMGDVVISVTDIAYRHAFTYDILPDSETGAYFAGGVLIGSTLHSLRSNE
jgi:hypothetical protein